MFDKIILNIPHSSTLFPTMSSKNSWNDINNLDDEIKIWSDHFTDDIFESKLDLNIVTVKYPFSRFYCDVERLQDDILENIGHGIIYNKSNNKLERLLSDSEKGIILGSYNYHHFNLSKEVIKNSLIIDCHSFPSNLSDVDICIGFNDDETKPSDEIIDKINKFFIIRGFKVGINNPYSNSICVNSDLNYKSIMIEVNKKLYMDEERMVKHSYFYKINHLMNSLYKILLNE